MRKNLRKMLLSIFVMGLFAFAFVSAQEPNTEQILFGETISSNFITEQEILSSSLGGLTSIAENIYREVVRMGLINVFVDEEIIPYQTFDILAFPVSSSVDLNVVSVGDVFATSEEILLNGILSSWATFNIVSEVIVDGLNTQPLKAVGEEFIVGSELVVITNYDTINNRFSMTLDGTPVPDVQCVVCDGVGGCISSISITDIESLYGLVVNQIYRSNTDVISVGDELIAVSSDDVEYFFLYRNNKLQDWDLLFSSDLIDGYQVSAYQGNSLALLPTTETIPTSFDVYIVM